MVVICLKFQGLPTLFLSKLNSTAFEKFFETGKFEEKSHIVHWGKGERNRNSLFTIPVQTLI